MLLGGAFRGAARCVARRERPRALLTAGRAVLKSKRVCVRAGRAAGLALWAGRKTSTAQVNERETLQELTAAVFCGWLQTQNQNHARVIDTSAVGADAAPMVGRHQEEGGYVSSSVLGGWSRAYPGLDNFDQASTAVRYRVKYSAHCKMKQYTWSTRWAQLP